MRKRKKKRTKQNYDRSTMTSTSRMILRKTNNLYLKVHFGHFYRLLVVSLAHHLSDDIFSNPISESNTTNKEQTIHLYLLSDRILIAKRKEQNELKVKRLPPDTNYQPNLPDEGKIYFLILL